jgi:hypothetical protein
MMFHHVEINFRNPAKSSLLGSKHLTAAMVVSSKIAKASFTFCFLLPG